MSEDLSISEQQINDQLATILRSDAFSGATKLRRFLRFILGMYCEGRSAEIKQYTVGLHAFSLGEDFDPQNNPVVRIEAGRLRRRLAQYYANEGRNAQLLIDIPIGSYIPRIRKREEESRHPVVGRPAQLKSPEAAYAAVPNEHAIAVLPFENMSSDKELDYFSDGITEEIITTLSLYNDLTVLPRWATKQPNMQTTSLEQVAHTLQVRYILEESVRQARERVRITVRLNDATEGFQLWTETFNEKVTIDNILNIQDKIAKRVTSSLANEYSGVISRRDTNITISNPTQNYTSYEAMLHLHHYNLNTSAAIYDQTLQAIEQALQKDPDNPMLLSALAELKIDGYSCSFANTEILPTDECQALLKKAISLDKDCCYAYFIKGTLKSNQRRVNELLEVAAHLQTFTYNPSALAQSGWFMALAGKWEEGLELLGQQLDLLKYYPGWFRHAYFLYHYTEGQYAQALDEARQFNMPGLLWDPVDRAAALGQLGNLEDGKKVVQELLVICPDFFKRPRKYLECYIMFDDLVDDVLQGLAKVSCLGGLISKSDMLKT